MARRCAAVCLSLVTVLGCGGLDSHDVSAPYCPKYCDLRDRCGFQKVDCQTLCGWVDSDFKTAHPDCYASAQGIIACLFDDPSRVQCASDHMTVDVGGCQAWERRAFCPDAVNAPRGAYDLVLDAACPGGATELAVGSWDTVPAGMADAVCDGVRRMVYGLYQPVLDVSEATVACESVSATHAMDMSVRIGLTQFSAHSDDFMTDQVSLTYDGPDVSLHTPDQTPCTLSNARANGVYYTGTLNCPSLVVDGSTAACSATGFIYFEVCDAH